MPMKRILSIAACGAFCLYGLAQPAVDSPGFIAGSVRPSPAHQSVGYRQGGPGTNDPGSLTLRGFRLSALLSRAYGVPSLQILGPNWLSSNEYDLAAKLSADTTEERLDVMLQNFLAEHFHLKLHHEQRELPVYFLVAAKSGPKLKPAEPAEPETAEEAPRTYRGGFIDLRPGIPQVFSLGGPDGKVFVTARMQSVAQIAERLGQLAKRVVVDKTGLSGNYDYKFSYLGGRLAVAGEQRDSSQPADPEPDPFDAIQQQLGLKLESGKAMVDCLIVDSADPVPSD